MKVRSEVFVSLLVLVVDVLVEVVELTLDGGLVEPVPQKLKDTPLPHLQDLLSVPFPLTEQFVIVGLLVEV